MSPGAYVTAALARECAEVAATRAGRNDRLNRAAFALGQFVAGGELDRGHAEHCLFQAALACGYVASDGALAARTTIRSGLDKGARSPRRVPEGERSVSQPRFNPPPFPHEPAPSMVDDDAKRSAALAIWGEGGLCAGTIVEAYLKSRGLELAEDLNHRALRFH